MLLAIVTTIAAAGSAHAAPPNSIVAIGDSFTSALFSGAPCSPSGSCPANSWSTGTNPAVASHYARLLELNPLIGGRNHLFAAPSKKVADMGRQAQLAIARNPEYVTVLFGVVDACRETEAAMTPVATFRSQFAAGLAALVDGVPQARIFVASIPDFERLRATLAGDADARARWAARGECLVALADPLSDEPAVVARRERARQRVIDFNRQLEEVCAQYATCRYDGGAVFRWAIGPADVVAFDYFHLSVRGQAALADVTRAAGYDFVAGPPPPAPPPPAPAPPPPPPAELKAPARPAGRCEAGRAPVANLTDTDASRIDFDPRRRSVGALRRLARPAVPAGAPRLRGEFSTYRVRVRLRSMRIERSASIRLVVADPSDARRTMLVRLPAPGCAPATRSLAQRRMAKARATLLGWCGRPRGGSTRALTGTATITGVAFYGALGNRPDTARNGLELAPVLTVAPTSRCRRR